jgi:hypothetical protein
MDTVIVCDDCGAELRFNFDGENIDPEDDGEAYDAFVQWALEEADEAHDECNGKVRT